MRPTSRSCTRTLLGLAFAAAAFSPFAAFAQNSDYERRIRPAASPTETLLASFTGTANGSTPMSSLVKSSSGLYYGVTSVGGTTNQGTLFCMTTAGVITTLYNFGASVAFTYSGGTTVTPEQPYGALIQGTDGNFYGTTYTDATTGSGLSGPYASGVIFKFTLTGPATAPTGGTLTILHQFLGNSIIAPNTAGLQDGKHPEWALIEGTDGYLYGQTHGGGAGTATMGLVFKIHKSGANYAIIHSFSAAGTDGNGPMGGVVESTLTAPDGTNYFYGFTTNGGVNGEGNVFKVSASGTYFYDLADFNYNKTTPLAGPAQPYGTPTIGTNGTTLYGVSQMGGVAATGSSPTSNDGVFFSVVDNATTATVTPLYAFSGHSDPGKPEAGIILGSDGNFYGTSEAAGGNSDGAIFKVSSAGVESVVYAFKGGATDGSTPLDNPVESPSGDLYLTTSAGGSTGSSTIAGDGAVVKLATGLTTPVSVVLSTASTEVGEPVTITYSSPIAYGATMSQCFATSVTPSGGIDPGWTGIKTVSPTAQTANVTPTATGTYTYTLTCGGSNSSTQEALTVTSFTGISVTSIGHDFGAVAEGTSAEYGSELTNNSGAAFPFEILLTGASDFTQQNNCGTSVAAGAKCEIVITYTAADTPEYESAGYTITANDQTFEPGNTGSLSAETVARGQITLNSNKHNFGGVTVGTTQEFGLIISNGTSAAQALTYTAAGDTAEFTLKETNCPATLPVNEECEVILAYTPAEVNNTYSSATYTLTTPATVVPGNVVTLLGYGIN